MKTMVRMAWVAATLVGAPAAGQEVVRLTGDDLAIYDLAGQVEIVRGIAPEIVVTVTRGGADAAQLRVDTGDVDGRSTLRVIFPGDEIVYPAMGRGSNNTMAVRPDGTFGSGGGSRVGIHGSGSGVEAWADLVVEVPAGKALAVYVGAGRIAASEVEADLHLDTGSGGVSANDIRGALTIDTGSGGVDVGSVVGSLSIDTGSGGVDITDVTGDEVSVDTGSGGVDATGIEAGQVSVDTGSGGVELMAVSSRVVLVDTGSGSIQVDLLTDVDRLDLDTGSGSVWVRATPDLGGMVEIETGGAEIDLDFSLEVSSVSRERVRGRLGDGEGTIRIDTASGSVQLIRRD